MQKKQSLPHVCILIPCYNEEDAFVYLQKSLVEIADKIESEFKINFLFVDDGSSDSTWKLIEDFSRVDSRVMGVSLSRNFGHQAALTCGYDLAPGDAVVCMDADMQHPPETLLDMLSLWRAGHDVVYAVREKCEGDTRFKLWTSRLFYKVIILLGGRYVKPNSGDFRLLSRPAVDALNGLREHHRFIRGMVGWIGFSEAEVRYRQQPRVAGKSKYPLQKMIRFAADAIFSFSSAPLRVAYLMAFGLMCLSYAGLLYSLFLWISGEAALVPGWTSLMLTTVAFGTACLLSIGVLGEYVGRIYEQVKNRPTYIVRSMSGRLDAPDVRKAPVPMPGPFVKTTPQ